ncbi:MAG: c-type cytochrome [Thiohalorhabdus sp.]|uniref:c-type cytochrome n=1 Tax=Thiohalorhabdus sp. TaxID=3094134 RepID=UPI003981594E
MRLRKGMVLGLTTVALAGCGDQEAYDPEAGTDASTMFEEGCAHCHGQEGQGKFGFLLSLEDTQLAEEGIADMIANGTGIMPAFPELEEDQRRDLARYVTDL